MKIKSTLLLIISVLIPVGLFSNYAQCWDLRDIDRIVTVPKSITKEDNFVFVKGRWKKY